MPDDPTDPDTNTWRRADLLLAAGLGAFIAACILVGAVLVMAGAR